jgi:hypothetical protein
MLLQIGVVVALEQDWYFHNKTNASTPISSIVDEKKVKFNVVKSLLSHSPSTSTILKGEFFIVD